MRIVAIVMIAFLLAASSLGCTKQTPAAQDIKVTEQQYEQVAEGATYEDVMKVVGGQGKLISESGAKDAADYMTTYQYSGVKPGTSVKFTFRQNKLVNKSSNSVG